MERPLTSWKEIAAHFSKSVRTVQRWEQQFGLPVHRPAAHDHGIVLSFPSELDAWLSTNLVTRSAENHSAPTAQQIAECNRRVCPKCGYILEEPLRSSK